MEQAQQTATPTTPPVSQPEPTQAPKNKNKNKKVYIIAGAVALALLVIIIAVAAISCSSNTLENQVAQKIETEYNKHYSYGTHVTKVTIYTWGSDDYKTVSFDIDINNKYGATKSVTGQTCHASISGNTVKSVSISSSNYLTKVD